MRKKHGNHFSAALAAIICLIAFGIGMILKNYHDYTEKLLEQQENQQLQLAQAVDRNLKALLEQSRNSLEYIIGLDRFRIAEEKWLSGQGSQDLLVQLTENHLSKNDLISCIIALQDDRIMLESQDHISYQFLNEDKDDLYRICLGYDGNVYLALICPGNGAASYASMIDLQRLYQRISSTELSESDQLLLMDQTSSVMLHYCTDSDTVKSTLLENCPDRKDFQLMLDSERTQTQGCFPFVYRTQKMSKGYNANIMILPSGGSENETFAVGLISNVDAALAPLEAASLNWLLGAGVILLGISVLLILVLHYRRRDAQIAHELELLQQKNIAMEELHRKTQEMAHHQRLEMIGTLTSGIAHEFNNLLTPIMGYSMLTLEQLPPELEELYDNVLEIYNTSRKAREITSQLSQYSRKNSGDSKTYLDPDLLIRKVLHVAMPSCPEEVTVEQQSDDSDSKIYGNETQLSQLFLNLILNAFHSMGEQGGKIHISIRREQGQAFLSVTDNGCGIPEETLSHIFEPFFTTKEGGKGSGLGLAIAQQIAEDHQGSIHVTSQEGKGSTFTVILPAYHS